MNAPTTTNKAPTSTAMSRTTTQLHTPPTTGGGHARAASSPFDGIGIALGSPNHPDQFFHQPLRPENDKFPPTPATTPPAELQRTKSRKWGFLSRSKSKRVTVANPDYTQQWSEPSPATPTPITSLYRGLSLRRKYKRPAPRSHTQSASTSSGQSGQSGRNTSPRRQPTGEIRRAVTHHGPPSERSKHNFSRPSTSIQRQPVIDVEIPNIKMERYSVMFSGLLQRQEEASSSLLARRQATLARLRAIEDSIDAGSKAVPAVSEKPASPGRSRSNTYPVLSTISSKNTAPIISKDVFVNDKRRPENQPQSTKTPITGSSTDENRPPLVSKFHPIITSPEAMISPKDDMPWDDSKIRRYAPSPSSAGSAKNFTRTRAESMAVNKITSPLNIPARSTSLSKPEYNLVRKKSAEDVYEVSIARQISVSREQRKLLEPLYEDKVQGGLRPPNYKNAAAKISIDGTKRLAETKSATPRYIHPSLDAPLVQEMHRRSERVIVEGV